MEILLRLLNRGHDICKRSHMEYPIHARKERRNRLVITNIRFNNRKARISLMMCQILQTPCTAVVDDDNILPFSQKPIDDMRADKAAAARNNRFHFIVLPAHPAP